MAIIRYSRKILQKVFNLQNSFRIVKNSEKNSNSLIQSSLQNNSQGLFENHRKAFHRKMKEYSISPLAHSFFSYYFLLFWFHAFLQYPYFFQIKNFPIYISPLQTNLEPLGMSEIGEGLETGLLVESIGRDDDRLGGGNRFGGGDTAWGGSRAYVWRTDGQLVRMKDGLTPFYCSFSITKKD